MFDLKNEEEKYANFLFLTTNHHTYNLNDLIVSMFNQPTLIMTYLAFVYIFIILCWAGHVENRSV